MLCAYVVAMLNLTKDYVLCSDINVDEFTLTRLLIINKTKCIKL